MSKVIDLIPIRIKLQALRLGLAAVKYVPSNSSSIDDLLSEKERLEKILANSSLPPYVRDALQADLDAINKDLLSRIEADYQARWTTLSIEDKKAILQSIHEQVAAQLGIDPLELQFPNLEDPKDGDLKGDYYNGNVSFWFDSDETIRVDITNVSGEDPYGSFNDVAKTVIHETYHQYQQYLVDNIDNPDIVPSESEMESQVEEWEKNYENYIKFEDDPEGYENQPLEKSAHTFALDYLENNFYQNEVENYS